MNSSYTLESLKQANDWLTRRLQLTEEQVREGEDVNTALTEENRLLKTAKASLSSRLEELCSELDHLRQCVQDYSFEKQNLQSKVGVLEQKVVGYEDDERTAKLMFEELKAEMEEAQAVIYRSNKKIEDMKECIITLEEANSQLVSEATEKEMANTKEVTDKNATIQEMQRKLNDLESSSINLQCSVKEESLDLIDENGVEHSSPGSIATNLEDYMKLQLAEKDNSIEELERRLESVQVANEIYQDQVNELKSKLDGVSESVGSGDIHMKVKDVSAVAGTPAEQLSDDERELYSALDDLLTKCRMSGGSGDSPAMDHIPPNVFSFSEYSAQTLNASSKVRNLHYRDVAPVSMANSSTQCSGYDLPKPSVSHTSSQYDAVLLHNQSVQVSTNLVSVEVQASLAGCKCSTVISDSVNAACQTQGALDSHVIKCDAGCQITQGATESQVTQGATDCQTTQGATECQTTQGATDCQTTQGAAECQATQGATECQTTQGARGCNEVESNCQNLEHLQHIPTDSSLEQLCQLRDVKDSPLRADTEILHDSHLLDTNLELQDYFIQLPLSCVGVEENHNVACSVCKSRTTLVPVADVATQTDVQSGDGIALGVILSDLQVSLENTSHALSTYNSAGNFTYNASLANEKITSDDELFGNVLHKSDGVVCPDTRLIPTFLSTTSCQKGTQATLYEVEGKPRLATSCDWMIIYVNFHLLCDPAITQTVFSRFD